MTPPAIRTVYRMRAVVSLAARGIHDRKLRAAHTLLAASVDAGDAGLWGNVIRQSMVKAALRVADGTSK